MKEFKKLALASAIATLPVSGFAMEALDDAALSDVTGQSGVTISIASMQLDAVRVTDADGLDGDVLTGGGAIFIEGVIVPGVTSVAVDADADTLQATISLGAATSGNPLVLGSIGVGAGTATAASTAGLIDLGSMTHGGISLNVQLGTEDQGSMIALSGTSTNGITLNDFKISDGDGSTGTSITGGAISTDLTLRSAGLTALNLSADIDLSSTGLVVSNLGAMDVTLGALTLGQSVADLGSAVAIGDVSILNLQLGAITISGH